MSFSGDATLIFETELMDIKKKSIDESVINLVRFLTYPVAAALIIYYVYQKYKNTPQQPSKRELKEEKRRNKKRH